MKRDFDLVGKGPAASVAGAAGGGGGRGGGGGGRRRGGGRGVEYGGGRGGGDWVGVGVVGVGFVEEGRCRRRPTPR